MIASLLIALLTWANVDASPAGSGTIHGIVVNGTRGNEAIGDVEVLLRAGPEGALEPVAATRTDLYGKFVFEDVPLDPAIVYLPGADRDGVHYPGKRIRLDSANRFAHVTIVAFDGVEAPSPLIAERHEIDVKVQQNVMEISEALSITNPSRATYVGARLEAGQAVTLRLSVPPTFDRVTFGSEFYGRRFQIMDHQPVTDIPWPPGKRELRFSYRVPIEKSGGMFRRTLDMPSRNVTLRVRGKNADELSCNLGVVKADKNAIVFTSAEELCVGLSIDLQIGTLPFPWLQYTRWGSLVALVAITMATAAVLRRRDDVSPSAERSE